MTGVREEEKRPSLIGLYYEYMSDIVICNVYTQLGRLHCYIWQGREEDRAYHLLGLYCRNTNFRKFMVSSRL